MARRDDKTQLWQRRKAERARRAREKKQAKLPAEEIDREQTLVELGSPDEATRARAARQLCPCHTDWQVFEQNLDTLRRMTKDSSPTVRANALHVFEDAFEIENEGLPTTPRAITNELVARRRQTRWRSGDGEPEEREARREDSPRRPRGR